MYMYTCNITWYSGTTGADSLCELQDYMDNIVMSTVTSAMTIDGVTAPGLYHHMESGHILFPHTESLECRKTVRCYSVQNREAGHDTHTWGHFSERPSAPCCVWISGYKKIRHALICLSRKEDMWLCMTHWIWIWMKKQFDRGPNVVLSRQYSYKTECTSHW